MDQGSGVEVKERREEPTVVYKAARECRSPSAPRLHNPAGRNPQLRHTQPPTGRLGKHVTASM